MKNRSSKSVLRDNHAYVWCVLTYWARLPHYNPSGINAKRNKTSPLLQRGPTRLAPLVTPEINKFTSYTIPFPMPQKVTN